MIFFAYLLYSLSIFYVAGLVMEISFINENARKQFVNI